MKNSDFLKILESFPGKEQLKRGNAQKLTLEYCYIDFVQLTRKITQIKFKLKLPSNNEEKWFKFLAFCCIATQLCLQAEMKNPIYTIDILEYKSKQVAIRICRKFDEVFHGSANVIRDISEITLEELIEFAKLGEPLF